jgi:hypothetical protein
MERYMTRRYVALDWHAAVRLARLEGLPLDDIRYSSGVEVLHRTVWWAWWSDQRLTTAIGLSDEVWPRSLSLDAVQLISEVWESDSAAPQCGWVTLAKVKRIVSCRVVRVGRPLGKYRPETWECLTVLFQDRQEGTLYRFWKGYDDGYLCDVRCELPFQDGPTRDVSV